MDTHKLPANPTRQPPSGPVTLVIMDGVGIGRGGDEDAVASASTPTLDWLRTLPSYRTLRAHGRAVGMPTDKDMGNSEVGHNALGAGRIFEQGAALVNDALASGRIYEGPAWAACINAVRASGEPLHFLGLLSDGNVHAHQDHLEHMIQRAVNEGVRAIRVHALLDGRDVSPRSALTYVDRLERCLSAHRAAGIDACVASGGGRMQITMDRYEANWGMVARGWAVHVRGEGPRYPSLRAAVEHLYETTNATDQDLPPFVIESAGAPAGPIRDGAAVILFNFRGDRAIEISRAFEAETFDAFDRGARPDVVFAGMMEYDGDLKIPARYLVAPPAIDRTVSERLAASGVRQFAIAETQKFGHVTYFWNGNRSGYFDGKSERYEEIPSDVVPFETAPWMQAKAVTDRLVRAMSEGFEFLRVNYANGDMVGHTGDLTATREAVEAVDACLGRLVEATRDRGGVLVVTADHGNADHMFDVDEDGVRHVRSSHSLYPVPFAIFDAREPEGGPRLRDDLPDAGLANVASTLLELLGFEPPSAYEPSLL